MKILGHNNINEIADGAEKNLDDLISKSKMGDIDASIQLIFYYIAEDKGISKRVFKYILNSINQGNTCLAEIIAELYMNGPDVEQLKITPCPKKAV